MNNTPTPTPRTDANDLGWQFHEQYDYFDSLSDDPIQWVDFARQLERELAAVTEQRDRLAEAIRKHKFCDFELWDALQSLNQPTQ